MRRLYYGALALFAGAWALIPQMAHAAGGKADMLVVVADTRVVDSNITKWTLDMYNTDPMLFGILCVVFTAILGGSLGLITDQIMKRTGIDLTSRKIVEH